MTTKTYAALLTVGFALSGCGSAVPSAPAPAPVASTTEPAPSTITAPPSVVVVVPPPVTITRAPDPVQGPRDTPCTRLFADGSSYTGAYNSWADAGYPLNWDADQDGYPCEQTYGNQN